MLTSADARRGDQAQRWASILVGLGVVALVGWMTLEASGPPRRIKDPSALKKTTDAAAPAAASSISAASTTTQDAGAEDLDAGLSLTGLGGLLLDASVMPSGAPRHVKIGVILVTFAGAEGAPPNARNKRDAMSIAERLAQDARSDFSHAVTGGDPGSLSDIGRLPRGVLDPRTEVAVFALGAGEVSEVLETPKGFWIVKRNE